MASEPVHLAIKNAVSTAVAGAYPVIDIDEARRNLAQGTTPFIAIEDIGGTEDKLTIGAPTAALSETGSYLLLIFTPSDGDLGVGRRIVDSLRDALRYRYLIRSATGNLRVTAMTPGAPLAFEGSLWHETECFMTYDYDVVRQVA